MSARVCIYPVDAVLLVDGFLLSADAVKTASAWTRGVRADAFVPSLPSPPFPSPPLPSPTDAVCCPRGREKIK
jgi:hypothetical protein